MSVIPQIEPLELFLGSLTKTNPNNSKYSFLLVGEEKFAETHENETYKVSRQKLWFMETTEFSILSVRRIMHKALQKKDHEVSDMIIDCVLLLFTYHTSKSKNKIDALNEILNSIQKVHLSQYFLPPGRVSRDFKAVTFGRFRIGRLDEQKLKYRCEKAQSDYYDLYKERLADRIAIERDFFDVNIIMLPFIDIHYFSYSKEFRESLLTYFGTLSRKLFDDFWASFIEDQFLQIAFGIDFIEGKLFRRMLRSEMVSIYLNIKAFDRKVGYVVPEKYGIYSMSFNFDFNEDIKKIYENLSRRYNFQKFNNSEIHNTIQTYIKFNSKAYIFLYEKKIDEAFLHFVIALDLLLGAKGNSVESVSNRTAVLTYLTFENTFEEQKKIIKKIYDARSKYVHKGQEVNPKLLDSLKEVCKVILEVLFHIQSNEKYMKPESIDSWLFDLDYAIASHKAGKKLKIEELSSIGIVKI